MKSFALKCFCVLLLVLSHSLSQAWMATAPNWSNRLQLFAGKIGGSGMINGVGTNARFLTPQSVAVDSNGNIFVLDETFPVIRKITPNLVVTDFAGDPTTPGYSDGTGAAAQFNQLYGITIDSSDNLYVTDIGANTIRKITPSAVVTTFAGAAAMSGSFNGTGTSAYFDGPAGIDIDSSGNLFVADKNNNIIRKITPGAIVTTFAGTAYTPGSTDATGAAARFGAVAGLAIDSANNIYVADPDNYTVRKITSAGVVTTFAGTAGASGNVNATGASARFANPTHIAIDGSDNLFVSEPSVNIIRKITSARVVTTFAGVYGNTGSADGTGTSAYFTRPLGLAADGAGNLYVAAGDNNCIRKITAAGVVTTIAGSPNNANVVNGTAAIARFGWISRLAVDSSGNIFVAEGNPATAIRKVTAAGVASDFVGVFATPGTTNATGTSARFTEITALAVDSANNVYVTDRYAVRKITSAGVVTTLAGNVTTAGSTNATGTSARFNMLRAVAVDSSGNVFVGGDEGAIRKITSAGVVTTLAGSFGAYGTNNGTGAAATFTYIYGMTVDTSGNIYVSDRNGAFIRKITPGGVVTTLAGTAGNAGHADGSAGTALFASPGAMTIDKVGNVYVLDRNGGLVRKITPAGVVTTVLGKPDIFGVSLTSLPTTINETTGIGIYGNRLFIISEGSILWWYKR